MDLTIGKIYYPKPSSREKYPLPMSVEGITENDKILVQSILGGIYSEITEEEMEYHFYTTDD